MAEGKFIISAQNKIKEGLDGAKKDLLGFEDAAKKVGDTIKNAFAVTAIAAGLKKLGDAAFGAYQEFGEMDRRMKQLKIALNNNETSYRRAIDLIDEMAKVYAGADDDIENLVAELAALGKSDAEIEKITQAAVNLSNVTGKDLNASFTLINATYAGTIGRLNQIIPEIGSLSKAELEAGGATDLINDRFTELTNTLAEDNIPQKIQNIKKAWGDLRENLGQAVAPLFNPLLEGFNAIIGAINGVMEARALEAKLDSEITDLEKKNSLQRLIAIKKEQLEKQKSYSDLILGMDMTGMLSAGAGNTATEAKVAATEAALVKLEAQLAALMASNPKLQYEAPARVPLLGTATVPSSGTKDSGESIFSMPPEFTAYMNAATQGVNIDAVKDWSTNYLSDQIFNAMQSAATEGLQASEVEAWVSEYLGKEAFNALQNAATEGLQRSEVDAWSKEYLGKQAFEALQSAATMGLQAVEVEEWANTYLGEKAFKALRDEATRGLQEAAVKEWATDYLGKNAFSALQSAATQGLQSAEVAEWCNEYLGKNAFDALQQSATEGLQAAEVKAWATDYLGAKAFEALQQSATLGLQEAEVSEWVSDYLGAEAFAALQKAATLGLQEADVNSWVTDYLGKQTFAGLQAAAEQGLQSAAVEEWTNDYLGAEAFAALQQAAEEGLQAADVEEWAQDYLGKQVFKAVMDNAELALQQADVARWEAGYLGTDLRPGAAAFIHSGNGIVEGQDISWFTELLQTAGDGIDTAFSSATFGMDSFSTALLGPISELMSALGPIANMLAGMNPLLALLIPVIEGFVSVIAPATSAVLKPLFDTLANIGVVLGQALLPIFDALAPIINMLAVILQATLIPVIQLLAPFIQIIALMIQPLGPAMGALAKAVIILMSPVQWLADLFSYVGEVLKTFAWNIAHPFRQQSGPGAFTSDAFSGLGAKLGAIDALMVNSQSLQNGTNPVFDASAATASQSASYRTQQITINVYQQAPVVGSGGMAEFVQMIRGQFAELAYYGA